MKLYSLACLLATSFSVVQALPTGKMDLVKRVHQTQAAQSNCCPSGTTAKTPCPHPKKLAKRVVVDICTVTWEHQQIALRGELARQTQSGEIFKVTEAHGLPAGSYVAKRGLGPNERVMSMAAGLAIGQDNAVDPRHQCLLLPFVGTPVTSLQSYQQVRGNEAQCRAWVDTKMTIVHAEIQRLRGLAHDWSHYDLINPTNTRWEGENKVIFIDYGEAGVPNENGHTNDDDINEIKLHWVTHFCTRTIVPHSIEFTVPRINDPAAAAAGGGAHDSGCCCVVS
ncbi:hypothetical protein FRC17_010514 [Serendipita sp. 399]|nr:hypothetical protein FRC17_010514 [Serendipita sp. 399]